MEACTYSLLRTFIHLLLLLMGLSACLDKPHTERLPKGEDHISFTENGAWCWFSDPRAIYYEGEYNRTYSGWVDSLGNVVIGFYDHREKTIETHILHRDFEKDDHNNPSFFMDPDGRLMVFYSKHATGSEPIFLARAKLSENISQWESLDTLRLNDTIQYAGLSNTYTYTNIIQLSEEKNKLYLFWRGADYKPNFSVSQDGGKNWSPGKILILPERIYKNRRPYIKIASNNKEVIHFAFTDGHPNAEPANSIYYAKYQQAGLYKANNEKILDWSALPIEPGQADMVYDAKETQEKAWIWDVAEDTDGQPVIVYSRFPSDSNHVYYYAVYDEGKWINYRLVDSGGWFPDTKEGTVEREPNYSGGIVLDHQDPSIVYLSRQKNGVFEIERWKTTDKGETWKVKEVSDGSQYDNVRPFVVRSHKKSDSLNVLWMNVKRYHHYTDYQSAIKMSVGQR
ncbi:MAG: BNR-4 repeat-containing protein [Cyclobacteriaceae bacterium]